VGFFLCLPAEETPFPTQYIKNCCPSLDCFAMPDLSWYQQQMTTAIPKTSCGSFTKSSLLEKD